MPAVRSSVLAWDVTEPDGAIAFSEAWREVLPGWIMANVREQLILPRLQRQIEAWAAEDKTKAAPLHTWLHPWLPLVALALSAVSFVAVTVSAPAVTLAFVAVMAVGAALFARKQRAILPAG